MFRLPRARANEERKGEKRLALSCKTMVSSTFSINGFNTQGRGIEAKRSALLEGLNSFRSVIEKGIANLERTPRQMCGNMKGGVPPVRQ